MKEMCSGKYGGVSLPNDWFSSGTQDRNAGNIVGEEMPFCL